MKAEVYWCMFVGLWLIIMPIVVHWKLNCWTSTSMYFGATFISMAIAFINPKNKD